MSESNTKFGDFIRERRVFLKLSLRQIAEKIKKEDGDVLSPQYLNDIEHNRRNPPSEYIIEQLAHILGVDKNYLLALKGELPTVKNYISEKPETGDVVGRLFRKAKEKGFGESDWQKLLEDIEKKQKK